LGNNVDMIETRRNRRLIVEDLKPFESFYTCGGIDIT